jgi:hypothetical protein
MNQTTKLLGIAIMVAMVGVSALALTMTETAFAQGVGNSKNFGQCKQTANNDRACEAQKGKFTGPDRR